MKPSGWIPRSFLYGILLMSVAATFVAVKLLKAPPTPMSEGDIVSFERKLESQTSALTESYTGALGEFAELPFPIEPADSLPSLSTQQTAFTEIQVRMSDDILNRIGVTSWEKSSSLQPSPVLDETLDEADILYAMRNSESTNAFETAYYESIRERSGDYISRLGYNALITAIQRDLIKYRTLESLPLYDIKLGLYREQAQALGLSLSERRNEADINANTMVSYINRKYSTELSGLISSFIATLANGGNGTMQARADQAVLDEIIIRLIDINKPAQTPKPDLRTVDVPEIDFSEWTSSESDYAESHIAKVNE